MVLRLVAQSLCSGVTVSATGMSVCSAATVGTVEHARRYLHNGTSRIRVCRSERGGQAIPLQQGANVHPL
jgi:hypothetical protein